MVLNIISKYFMKNVMKRNKKQGKGLGAEAG